MIEQWAHLSNQQAQNNPDRRRYIGNLALRKLREEPGADAEWDAFVRDIERRKYLEMRKSA